MDSSAAAAPTKREGSGLAFNLAVIALGAAMLGLGLAYAIDAVRQSEQAVRVGTLSSTLGGRQLEIPAGWARGDGQGGNGFAKQVDLALTLPLGPAGAMREIGISLMPRSRARPSASLLDGVYLHQFMPEQLSGAPGLIGKPLVARDGFADETVWYDALSPNPFVAKCIAPVLPGQPGRCLRTVHLGPGIAAVYSFDQDVLANWHQFDAALAPALGRIGAL